MPPWGDSCENQVVCRAFQSRRPVSVLHWSHPQSEGFQIVNSECLKWLFLKPLILPNKRRSASVVNCFFFQNLGGWLWMFICSLKCSLTHLHITCRNISSWVDQKLYCIFCVVSRKVLTFSSWHPWHVFRGVCNKRTVWSLSIDFEKQLSGLWKHQRLGGGTLRILDPPMEGFEPV